eukprot:1181911-Prorocentrum_minimum.AAC.2
MGRERGRERGRRRGRGGGAGGGAAAQVVATRAAASTDSQASMKTRPAVIVGDGSSGKHRRKLIRWHFRKWRSESTVRAPSRMPFGRSSAAARLLRLAESFFEFWAF